MTFRAAIVAAVSRPEQATRDKASLPEQLARCQAECSRRGWSVLAEITIPGHSRSYRSLIDLCADSPQYAEMVALIRAETVDLIITYAYDRLWRTDALRSQLTVICEDHRVQIFSLSEPVEPLALEELGEEESDSAMILQAMGGVFSQQEVRRIVRRHRTGMFTRTSVKGLFPQGRVPLGYRRVDTDKPLELIESEAAWVRWIYERRAESWGLVRIAEELNGQGITTRYGNAWEPRVLPGLLSNPIYAGGVRLRKWTRTGPKRGQRKLKGEVVTWNGQHPAIISRELWDEVQRVNRLMRERGRGFDSRPPTHPLKGIVRCGYCGAVMVCIKGSRYYACGTYYHWGGRKCQCNTHKRESVEAAVWERVSLRLADPEALADELLTDRGNGHQEELSRMEAQQGDLAQRRRRILEAIESGDFDLRALAEREAALFHQEKALSARIEALRARQTDAQALRARILDLSQIVPHFQTLSPQEQNRCYARLLRAVRLSRGNIDIEYAM
jgi:site-specific DNA recombinase